MRPSRAIQPHLLLLPTLVLLGVFFVYPLFSALNLSLYSWDLLTPPRYVGLSNYRELLARGALLQVFLATLGYSVMVVVGSMSIGLGLALLLDRPGRLAAFCRGAIFSAYVVSWVSVALLWLWVLDERSGILGHVAARLGMGRLRLLSDPSWAAVTLACVTIWKIAGYAMVLFITGLQDIPTTVLEAASLDGAGRLSRFRHVIWPLLRPTTAFVATTSLIVSFQVFDVVRIMTQGGPVRATTFFVYAIYEQLFVNLRVGRASALVVVFFVLLLGLTLLQFRLLRDKTRAA